ncbi:Alpha-(1,3)-fucosyltransferase C [Lamellibrachia satsuma]|nr:Alpha-(1,3)-fucosyltransferase C [Lamellibrachia satsuma]
MVFVFVTIVIVQVVITMGPKSTIPLPPSQKPDEKNVVDRMLSYDKQKLNRLLDVFYLRHNNTSLNRTEGTAFVTKLLRRRKRPLKKILQALFQFSAKYNVNAHLKTNVQTTDWKLKVNNASSQLSPTVEAEGKKVIRILRWTSKYVTSPHWFPKVGREVFNDCDTPIPCEYTEDKTMYSTSDIILIHPFYVTRKRQMPRYRLPRQKWLFFEREAPSRVKFDLKPYDSWFNITYAYTSNADIVAPYGVCLPNLATVEQDRSSITAYIRALYGASAESAPWLSKEHTYSSYNRSAGKSRLVAWMVSHCNAQSKRDDYVTLLKRYIEVDIYGECGTLSCSKSDTSCRTLISRTYKFYLAFENSLCSEYITEKLWRPLQQDVVPIVLGGADYETYLPKHSYINVKDFKSPYELAKYLKVLDKNDTLYNEYFDWKKSYSCYRGVPGKSIACNMCRHANENINRKETVPAISEFWSKKQCISPKQFYKGIAHIFT